MDIDLFVKAILDNDEATWRSFLDKENFDLNQDASDGYTPLLAAIEANNKNLVVALLGKGITVTPADVQMARMIGKAEIVNILIAHIEMKKQSAMSVDARRLFAAVKKKSVKELTDLLGEGLNPNQIDQDGNSLLSIAAKDGSVEIVRLLLTHQEIDPNLGAPLFSTLGGGQLYGGLPDKKLEIYKLLLNHSKTDPNTKKGNSILLHQLYSMMSLMYKNDYIDALLSHKALNVNEVDKNGKSLLHILVENAQPEPILELLKDKRVDFAQLDNLNCTALSYVYNNKKLRRRSEILDAFRNAMGEDAYRKQILAQSYKHSIDPLSKGIFLGLDEKNTSFQSEQSPSPIRILSNFSGYDSSQQYDGNELTFQYKGKEYPIGYVIQIPSDNDEPIENVVVEIYGGNTRADLHRATSSSTLSLEHRGCAVIRLSLPDFLQRQLQYNMDPELHQCIHSAIDHFYHTIKEKPESLHGDLEKRNLQHAKYFLFGASFGGGQSVRHGQLYPGTFNGYISHDGYFLTWKDLPSIKDRIYQFPKELFPYYHVEDMQDPVLIFQNRDDNNVNILGALEFYSELIRHGKEELARLCFFEKGNPIPGSEIVHKGHFPPGDMARYNETILNFMQHPLARVPEYQYFAFLNQKRYANQFLRDVSDSERFVSLAHQHCHDNDHSKLIKEPKLWKDIWDKEYKPILQTVKEVNFMVVNNDYRKKQMQRLVDQGLLTDDALRRALKRHFNMTKEYLLESEGVVLDREEFVNNPYILEVYKNYLVGGASLDKHVNAFVLENFYFSNPELLPPIPQKEDPDHPQPWTMDQFNTMEEEMKLAFELEVKIYKGSIRQVWVASADLSRKKEAASRKAESEKLRNILSELKLITNESYDPNKIKELFSQIVSINNDVDRNNIAEHFFYKINKIVVSSSDKMKSSAEIIEIIKEKEKENSLHWCSVKGYTGLCQLLIEHDKPDINGVNLEQETPLMLAAKEGHLEICQLLLTHEADVIKTNAHGQSAYDLAKLNDHDDICKLLLTKNPNLTSSSVKPK